jgi:hypothetical protein
MAVQHKKTAAVGTKAPCPGFIEPALDRAIEKAPSGHRSVHEIKLDGYNVRVHLRDGAMKVFIHAAVPRLDQAFREDAPTHPRTTQARRLSTARWLSRPHTVRPTSQVAERTKEPIQKDRAGRLRFLYLNGYDFAEAAAFQTQVAAQKR